MATGVIAGFGGAGYRLAMQAVAHLLGRARPVGPGSSAAIAGAERRRPGGCPGYCWSSCQSPWTSVPASTACGAALAALDDPPDALLVTSLTNIRYLTGFTGSAGLLFVLPDDGGARDRRSLWPPRRASSSHAAGVDARVVVAQAPDQGHRARETRGRRRRSIAWPWKPPTSAGHQQRSIARDWFPDVELVPTVGLVEGLRRVKDPGELDRLAEAARIADEALDRLRPELGGGLTEEAFGRSLDFEMRRLGASGPSFETIVASGPNAAMPHHRPGSRVIQAGEPVVLDFGARFDGYCSDMTRTVWVGPGRGRRAPAGRRRGAGQPGRRGGCGRPGREVRRRWTGPAGR